MHQSVEDWLILPPGASARYLVSGGFTGDIVRLADYIERNVDTILTEWVTFARTCGPMARDMDMRALRDHAVPMLANIVDDLRTPQSERQQSDKSKGIVPAGFEDRGETAAEVHGAGRAESGFTMVQMVSEYRALRASVIRLWTKSEGSLTGDDLEDLMRFNEAIDQSLAESVSRYTGDVDRSKDMFVAILGHDLRSPLGAVLTASQFMLETGELAEPQVAMVKRIVRSASRMNQMVGDLLDFTRSRLGSGVPIVPVTMDLGSEVLNAVEEARSAHPNRLFEVDCSGDLRGSWDCARVAQVMANLLGNAVQHGSPDSTIRVMARGEPNEVVFQVHNLGPAIPDRRIPGLFSPFKRLQADATPGDAWGSLGLGLHIVERIVTAHGGTIQVRSSADDGTFFTMRLPR